MAAAQRLEALVSQKLKPEVVGLRPSRFLGETLRVIGVERVIGPSVIGGRGACHWGRGLRDARG